MIKRSWQIFPVDENGLNHGKCKYSYTYEGKNHSGWSRYTELKRPVDTARFKKHKENLVLLAEELIQEDGALTSFHFCSDQSAQEHGVFGWGFTVKKYSKEYSVVLSSYIDSHGTRKRFEDDTMLRGHCHPDLFYKNPDKYFSTLSKNEHPYYSYGLSLELRLKGTTIFLDNIGDAVKWLEEDKVQRYLDLGIIQESELIVELGLVGYPKNIEKYLTLFKDRLGTVFIELNKK